MKPLRGRYLSQYFWDTCFNVFSMCAVGHHEMAKKCIFSLFALQKQDGFVGHIVYWRQRIPKRLTDIFQNALTDSWLFKPHMSRLLQPPLAARAVLRIYEESGDITFVKEILPKLKKYYKWIIKNRCDNDGLVRLISYFESGMDWKPSFDEVIGLKPGKADWKTFIKVVIVDFKNFVKNYNQKKLFSKGSFVVKDAGFNTIFADNLSSLSKLCEIAGDPDKEYFEEKAKQTGVGIVKNMYDQDDKAFYDLGPENNKLKVLTPTVLFPILLKEVPDRVKKEVVIENFYRRDAFKVPYPLPSVDKNHPSFNPEKSIFIWRGGTWMVFNWFLHHCLIQIGLIEEASLLLKSAKELLTKSGFREYYNPLTGEGYGANSFTWGGLVTDMINKEENLKREIPDN